MKKIVTSALSLIVTLSLFSSCSSSSSIALTKRHYRSGYYVDWRSKRHVMSTSTVATRTDGQLHASITPTPNSENSTPPNTRVLSSKRSNTSQITSRPKYLGIIANRKSNYDMVDGTTPLVNALAPESNKSIADHQDRVDANVAFVVIVLCAIFIPPLGVALMYGIHGYFWIDLILTLIFFFPGMIFALIVVLS